MSNAGLWLLAAAASMWLATSWLALSLPAHWRQVFSAGEVAPGYLRVLGWLALGVSVLCCFQADHPSMAVLVWFTLLPLAAVATAMTLSYRPALLRLACPVFLFSR